MEKTRNRAEFLWLMGRVFTGFTFAYAGASKLMEPLANFEAVLLKYGVFSPSEIPLLARVVPWAEWFTGAFLIMGYAPRWAAAGSSFLALCFLITLGSSQLLLEAGGTDCGCFGSTGLRLNLYQIFVIDLLNLAISLRLIFQKRHPFSVHEILLKRFGEAVDKNDG